MDKARETLVERLLAPNPIELTLAADDRAVLRQALSARQAEREEAAADLTRLNAKVEELERERLKLRTALIGTGRNLGAFLADDVSSDFLTLLPEEARLLKARLARAVEVMRRVNPALSAAFQGGMEEREGGSANRQARYMESVDQLRADARAFLSEQENRHGNG